MVINYLVVWALLGVICYANLPTRYTIGRVVPTVPYLAGAKLRKIETKQPVLSENEIQASELFNASPVLIMAVRRPGCAFCQKQASLLNRLTELQSRGVRLVAVFHEPLDIVPFWVDLKWDLYFDPERRFYGPNERWLPIWWGCLRFSTYWHAYKTFKAGFKGNFKGEGRLLGGSYLIYKDKMIFSHLESEWGDEVSTDELINALKKINNMDKITIYTIPGCPYCIRAKALLKQKNLAYEEINVEKEADRRAMIEKTGGKRSVPQIFIGKKHVGGCDDLYALDKEGKL